MFSGDSIRRTSGNRCRIVSGDPSVDLLSTTMISEAGCVWARTRSRQSVRRAPPLKLLTTTLTAGRRRSGGAPPSAASGRSVRPGRSPSAFNKAHPLILAPAARYDDRRRAVNFADRSARWLRRTQADDRGAGRVLVNYERRSAGEAVRRRSPPPVKRLPPSSARLADSAAQRITSPASDRARKGRT